MALEVHPTEQESEQMDELFDREQEKEGVGPTRARRVRRQRKTRFLKTIKEELSLRTRLLDDRNGEIGVLRKRVADLECQLGDSGSASRRVELPVGQVKPMSVAKPIASLSGQRCQDAVASSSSVFNRLDRRLVSGPPKLPPSAAAPPLLPTAAQPPLEDLLETFVVQLRARLNRSRYIRPRWNDMEHPQRIWEHLLKYLERTRRPGGDPPR